MELVFSNACDPKFDVMEKRYQQILEATFKHLNVTDNYEVDVSFVDDETIHQINKDYRGVDRVTDVISFAFNDDKDPAHQINDPDIEKMLGEILISVPQAERQAKDIGNSLYRELSFLFTHGLLHLLGYDHMKKEDEKIMFGLQDEILEGIPNEQINFD